MPHIIVRHPFRIAKSHGQQRLGPIQGLHLALFVHAQHESLVGWTQIQTHHVTHFLNEERIGGELETLLAVGLQAEQLEEAMHRGFRDAGFQRHLPDTPVSTRGRLGVQGLVDQLGNPLILNGARSTGAQFVVQSGHSRLNKAAAPLAYRCRMHA